MVRDGDHEVIHTNDMVRDGDHEVIHTSDMVRDGDHEVIHTSDMVRDGDHEVIHTSDMVRDGDHEVIHTSDMVRDGDHEVIHTNDMVRDGDHEEIHTSDMVRDGDHEVIHTTTYMIGDNVLCVTNANQSGKAYGLVSPRILYFDRNINELADQLENFRYHLYADVFQMYVPCSACELHFGNYLTNKNRSLIQTWSITNAQTSHCIIISSQREFSSVIKALFHIQYFPNNTSTPVLTNVKNLRVFVDSALSWREQVNDMCEELNIELQRVQISYNRLIFNLEHRNRTS
ncbi:hypothetical protein PR048_031931 [Dryococelus australis]|uniref:Thiol oxidase n=1 Tax=Dryococelus australis TaxID=614101 RepID=A0ABQ9G9G7_9NEOP|nr:hypothetical protein PR048_031931 [Dryococelus australis]